MGSTITTDASILVEATATLTTIESAKAPVAIIANGNGNGNQKRHPQPIAIRKATPQDAEQIAALGAAVFTFTFKDSGCTDDQLTSFLDEAYTVDAIRATLEDPGLTTFVAIEEDDNEVADPQKQQQQQQQQQPILGFLLLNTTSSAQEPAIANPPCTTPPTTFPNPIEVQRLYVALQSHGKGVGKRLMRHAEAFAIEQGYETCWLGVWERNFVAQKLYAGFGYRRVGEHVFDVGGDAQTDWILAKRL